MVVVVFESLCAVWANLVFWRDEKAATAIEYALIGAGIALAIMAVVFIVGGDVLGLFEGVETTLESNL